MNYIPKFFFLLGIDVRNTWNYVFEFNFIRPLNISIMFKSNEKRNVSKQIRLNLLSTHCSCTAIYWSYTKFRTQKHVCVCVCERERERKRERKRERETEMIIG